MTQFMDHQKKSEVIGSHLVCNNKTIFTSMQNDISKVPWDEWEVEFIIDSSGVLDNTNKSRELLNNKLNKRILFTNSPENVDFTMILGVNENKFEPNRHYLIASSICDATAIAQLLRLLMIYMKLNLDM